jgi:hypothetical protein
VVVAEAEAVAAVAEEAVVAVVAVPANFLGVIVGSIALMFRRKIK